jgi:hypothetical protein
MFHYGWARPAQALKSKRAVNQVLYPWSKEREAAGPLLPWFPGLKPFAGTHPAVARQWVEARRFDPERRVESPHFRLEHLRFYASDAIESLTGARVFEFRNYKLV